MTKYTNLNDHLKAWGLKVSEVSGWQTRSAKTTTFTPKTVTCHHTAGPTEGNAPTLGYIRDNVLSQFVLGRDGTVYIVSGNRANHAGFGGPLRGVPKDSANRYSWGIEAENNGRGEPWSEEQIKAYARLSAALCSLMGVDEQAVFAHREWAPSRKRDPLGISMEIMRSMIAEELKRGKGGVPEVALSVYGIGDSGSKVVEIQTMLNKLGYKLVTDGDFGPATAAAVKNFQMHMKLLQDGLVGPATFTTLQKRVAEVTAAPGPIAPVETVIVPSKPKNFVRFEEENHVYEVVGSKLYHVSGVAWRARGLTGADVSVLPNSHPLSSLARIEEY